MRWPGRSVRRSDRQTPHRWPGGRRPRCRRCRRVPAPTAGRGSGVPQLLHQSPDVRRELQGLSGRSSLEQLEARPGVGQEADAAGQPELRRRQGGHHRQGLSHRHKFGPEAAADGTSCRPHLHLPLESVEVDLCTSAAVDGASRSRLVGPYGGVHRGEELLSPGTVRHSTSGSHPVACEGVSLSCPIVSSPAGLPRYLPAGIFPDVSQQGGTNPLNL